MVKATKYFFLSLFLPFILIISSCDNFLGGADVKEQLDSSIKYANSPVFTVRIAPEDSAHGIVVSGAIKEGVRVTDKFDLDFSPSTDYTFLGWDAVKKDDHSVSFAQNVVFSEPKSLSTSVQIVKGNDDIYKGQLQLRPLCRPIEKGIINITSTYGAVSYNSEAEYKEGTLLKLTFNPNPGYGFTHWVVMIGNSYDTTGEYVKIENSANTVTDATFLKRPENNEIIYLIPVCVERPAVISKTPQLSENGVCRDSRIKVLFDSPMNEGSLYYTSAEYTALGTGISPLCSSADPKKIYGYTKGDKKYYKNIEIKDQNSGKSLLEYFGEPKFVSSNMLIIPTNDEKVLPLYTELLVTLSSGFYTKTSDGYDVSLDGKVFWNYLVNNETDNGDPVWTKLDVQAVDGVFVKRDGTAYDSPYNFAGNWVKINEETTTMAAATVEANGYKYFARNGIIKVNAEFSDVGTGPEALYLNIKSLTNISFDQTIELPIRVMGNKGVYQQPSEDGNTIEGIEIRLADEDGVPLTDGKYSLTFTAEDGAGRTKAYGNNLYVLIDNTNVAVSLPSSSSIYEDKITFGSFADYSSSFYFYQLKKPGETEYSNPVRINSVSASISNLEPGNSYKIKFFKCDDYGNNNNFIEFTRNTKPAKPQNVTATVSQTSNKKVTVNWKKGTNPNYNGATITAIKYNPVDGSTSNSLETITADVAAVNNQDEYSYSFDNLPPGYRYMFNVSSYDTGDSYNTNENIHNNSDEVTADIPADDSTTTTNVVLPPDLPTNFAARYEYMWLQNDEYGEWVVLNWSKPKAGFANAYYYSYKDASDASSEWSTPVLYSSYLSSVLDKWFELPTTPEIAGKQMKFKIWSAVVNSSDVTTKYAQSRDAVECSFFVPPTNLQNLVIDSKTNATITLKWDQMECNYDGAKIGYKKYSDNTYTWVTVPKGTTSYTLESLAGGTTYDIQHYTYINNGNTTVTSGIREKESEVTKPNPITNLKAEPLNGSQVKFTWTKPEGRYAQIKFYKKLTTSSSYSSVAFNTISDASEYFIWDLESDELKNVYNVKAIVYSSDHYDNDSPDSEEIIAYSITDPVRDLKKYKRTDTQIIIDWNSPATSCTNIIVSYKTDGEEEQTQTLSGTGKMCTMNNLTPGKCYEIKVETVSTKNGIRCSNSKTISINTRLKKLTVNRPSAGERSLFVTWTVPSGIEVDGFEVFYSKTSTFSYSATSAGTFSKNTRSCTVENLISGQNYYIFVVYYVGDGSPGVYGIVNDTLDTFSEPNYYNGCPG